MKNVLVTGGAGFIGSNFIRFLLGEHANVHVVNYDKLTYAGNLESLDDVAGDERYTFVRGDVCDREFLSTTVRGHEIDTVVHFAAESHVDRSILGAGVFANTNVSGTLALLDVARDSGVDRFLHVSTDEVYGSLGPTGRFTESTPLHPNSPYAASKAGSDLFVLAYHHTFALPVILTRCSNNYGPFQFPEKLIPLMIVNALNGKPLPVYGDGMNVRDWLFVEDHCAALDALLLRGRTGEVYNIGGENEWTNIDTVRLILEKLERSEELITFVRDRPGHDRRYAIDAGKLKGEVGWLPRMKFSDGIDRTISWYREHRSWWERVMSGEYQEYYRTMYDGR